MPESQVRLAEIDANDVYDPGARQANESSVGHTRSNLAARDGVGGLGRADAADDRGDEGEADGGATNTGDAKQTILLLAAV
jgi:hypothetical protein